MKTRTLISLALLFGAIAITEAQTPADPDIYEKRSRFTYEETIQIIKEAVVTTGWTNPNNHDMMVSMKKSGKEVKPAIILVLCHSGYAYEILKNDNSRKLMSMMPCRVAIYEKANGNTYVAWTNLLKQSPNVEEPLKETLKKVAKDLTTITDRVVAEKK